MSNTLVLIRRELGAYFVNHLAYIILTAFLIVTGIMYWILMQSFEQNRMKMDYGAVQMVMVYFLTLTSPLITMRLVAEEKYRGTIETIMTAPVSEWQFVLAKFSSAIVFLCYLILPSICYWILSMKYGTVDFGAMVAGYLGVVLALGAVLSVGIFISSLCMNQVTAGILTLMASLSLILLSEIGHSLPQQNLFQQAVRSAMIYASLLGHMADFGRGIVDIQAIVYLGSVTFAFLFLTVRVVESRRWR